MPPHHSKSGFRNPWPDAGGPRNHLGAFLRWRRERLQNPPAPNPVRHALAVGTPAVARPAAPADEVRITWIGQATFLVQIGGMNVLTDPMFSPRASPVPWAGPKRLRAPALALADLPEIHAVVVSHDHFDHLDGPTVRWLARSNPEAEWTVPLGFHSWLRARSVRRVHELDWWDARESGALTITALPAQHWCARGPLGGGPRLWSAWEIRSAQHSVFFAGDSGYCPAYREIGASRPPFDAVLMPIGAYAPRWFMRPAHMDPDEAVQAYRDLGGAGHFFGMHWGTFRLSDEPLDEPPVRARAAWEAAALPPDRLHVEPPGSTLVLGP